MTLKLYSKKEIKITNLQPIHNLDNSKLCLFCSLPQNEIENLGLPQIWETEMGEIISDGHHRTAAFYLKNKTIIKVEYADKKLFESYHFKIAFQDFFDELLIQAENMQKKGIYSIADFFR